MKDWQRSRKLLNVAQGFDWLIWSTTLNELVDLNYNFEYDWLIALSNYKLSDNNLAGELVENSSFFFKPIAIEEIEIFMINLIIVSVAGVLFRHATLFSS